MTINTLASRTPITSAFAPGGLSLMSSSSSAGRGPAFVAPSPVITSFINSAACSSRVVSRRMRGNTAPRQGLSSTVPRAESHGVDAGEQDNKREGASPNAEIYPNVSRRSFLGAAAVNVAIAALGTTISIGGTSAVHAAVRPEPVNRPDLLPTSFSTVIDLENFIPSGDERRLRERLADIEARTAFKIRVLTQRYPVTPGLAVRDYWEVDDRTVVLVADYFNGGGSLLHFTVGDEVANILPPRFWSVLTSAFGNRFYVSKNGEDTAILAAVDAISTCLLQKGCSVPPQDVRAILEKSV